MIRKTTRIGLAVLFLATVIVVFVKTRQPAVRGKPADAWVKALTSDSADSRAEAEIAVRELGSNAVPILLEKITTPDRKWRETLATGPATNFFVITTKSESRRQARKGFMVVGRDGKSAIPDLVKLLDDPNTASDALQVLLNFDNSVIPALLIAATNQEQRLRSLVHTDLGHRHTNAPGVIAALMAGLKDPVAEVRSSAILALGKIPYSDQAMVVALTEALTDTNTFVRSAAAQTLGSFGSQAKAAVPVLTRMFHGTNGLNTNGLTALDLLGQRMSAGQALRAIDPEEARRAGVPELKPVGRVYE